MNDNLKAAILIANAAKLNARVAALNAENLSATSPEVVPRRMTKYLDAIHVSELDNSSVRELLDNND